MKPILISITLAILFSVGNINTSIAQTPEQLYQKGLGKEEGEGALQDAINLYNQVADNSNASISLRAKALLHIGMCFEKLGTNKAVKAYQRLVSNFPTQKNEVAIAKERLTRLTPISEKVSKTTLTPKFTKINIATQLNPSVKLSPDGKNLALVVDRKL
jgi:tetratricopeptide (TPR) repeat protein